MTIPSNFAAGVPLSCGSTRVASYGIYTVWRVLLEANLYVLHFAHVAFFYIAGLANPDIFPRSAPAWVSFGGIKDAAG